MATDDSDGVKSQRWTVTLIEEGEDLILPFPDDMLEIVGWKTGDILQWVCNDNNTWTLQKKERSESEDS